MLIGRYSVLDKHPGREIGGGAIGLGVSRFGFNKSSQMRSAFASEAWEPKSGLPDGYRPPYSWVLPQDAGGLSARNNIVGAGTVTALAQSGYNIGASISGSGSVSSSDLGLIVSIAATLVASGGVSSAATEALASIVATLTGSGSVTATAAGLAALGATLIGAGTITPENSALMDIAATIRGYGDLTPEGLRDAVWGALSASYDDAGTMGEKLNDAGSASNPWTEVIESGLTAAEILRLILATTANSATGLETGVPVFKSVDETKDRITATYASGTRTVTDRDAS